MLHEITVVVNVDQESDEPLVPKVVNALEDHVVFLRRGKVPKVGSMLACNGAHLSWCHKRADEE